MGGPADIITVLISVHTFLRKSRVNVATGGKYKPSKIKNKGE
jgi:hypothetical protein